MSILLEKTLTLSEVLFRLGAGERVSLDVVTYDKGRHKGGEVMQIAECALLIQEEDDTTRKGHQARDSDTAAQLDAMREEYSSGDTPAKRDPHHLRHYTRNLRLYVDGSPSSTIVKIHPPLILKCNGATVI